LTVICTGLVDEFINSETSSDNINKKNPDLIYVIHLYEKTT